MEIPRPAGENAGLRDDADKMPSLDFKTYRYQPFALTALGHLYSSFALTLSTEPGVVIFHAQAYIPT